MVPRAGRGQVVDHQEPLKEELQRIGAGEVDFILCAASTEKPPPEHGGRVKPQGRSA